MHTFTPGQLGAVIALVVLFICVGLLILAFVGAIPIGPYLKLAFALIGALAVARLT